MNSLSNEVVEAVLGSGLKKYVINLMTMDYGSASSSVCVIVSCSCEMVQSAIQAVKNLEHTYGIVASKIAVTPMIGLNDNTGETFTPADVCLEPVEPAHWSSQPYPPFPERHRPQMRGHHFRASR